MLFEQTMWRGLAARLVRLGLPPYFAMQMAAACYPNGAKKAMQGTGFVFATPIVSPQQAALAVSRFEAAGPRGAPELFVPILVVLFGQERVEQWREELLQADAEAAADARIQQLESQYEAALRELGLPPTASLADVQKQYKSLCRQFHPDRNQHEPEEIQAKCDRQMASINRAYEVAVAWLKIAETAPVGRRPPSSARNAETATGAGPTPATTPDPQKTGRSPSGPKQTTPVGRGSPSQSARPLSSIALLSLVGLFFMGLIGVAAVQEHRKHTTSKPKSVPADQIASLRSQLQSLDSQIQSTDRELVALRSKRAAAMRATAELTEELKQLWVLMPVIEEKLDRANQNLEEALKEAAAYEREKKTRRPPPPQRNAKTHAMATTNLATAMDAQKGLAHRVNAGRIRLEDGPKELAAHQATLSKSRESLEATEQKLVRMKADRDRLQTEVAAAEARLAAERPLIAAAKQSAAKRAQDAGLNMQSSGYRQSADVPAFIPGRDTSGRALSHLPPAVRTLILAEAAGLDTGVDLLPDDEGGLLIPPIVPPLDEHGTGWLQQVPSP